MTTFQKDEVHPSHVMTEWKSSIITLIETPRFGSIRQCTNCGAEHGRTAAGEGMHDELKEPCTHIDTID